MMIQSQASKEVDETPILTTSRALWCEPVILAMAGNLKQEDLGSCLPRPEVRHYLQYYQSKMCWGHSWSSRSPANKQAWTLSLKISIAPTLLPHRIRKFPLVSKQDSLIISVFLILPSPFILMLTRFHTNTMGK
jgi:hypothetical protein